MRRHKGQSDQTPRAVIIEDQYASFIAELTVSRPLVLAPSGLQCRHLSVEHLPDRADPKSPCRKVATRLTSASIFDVAQGLESHGPGSYAKVLILDKTSTR